MVTVLFKYHRQIGLNSSTLRCFREKRKSCVRSEAKKEKKVVNNKARLSSESRREDKGKQESIYCLSQRQANDF